MRSGRDQEEAIAFLADPSTYGARAVERFDTHASIVFLAGEHAYKLKRAVKFSYLDYSTVELRRHFCTLELALNRRTAPMLYLAVRSINRAADAGLALDGEGPALDWILVMRRFEQDALFDQMADRGALTAPLMLALADRIADFHADAEPVADSGGHGGIARTAESDAGNLRAAVPDMLAGAAVERLVAGTTARIAALAPLLEARRQAGKVRHCHGDLHLRNICLIEGRPTLFDCIEFSREMSCIDVLYDLAFLLMDLDRRALGPLGNALFNRYLDLTDEADGIAALPLFLAMRAGIRAHVSAAAARQADSASAEARAYLDMALGLLDPPLPRLVAIGGLSGTGKSTLAYGLAPELGATPGARVLRSDVIRKRLFGVDMTTRLPAEAYDRQVSTRVFAALRAAASRILGAGHSVVADGVYARASERTAIADVAGKAGVPFVGLWLEAPPDILARRLEARRGDASDASIAVLKQQLAYDLGAMAWQRVDASAEPETVLSAARAAIDHSRAR